MSDFFSARLKALRGDRNKAVFSRFLGIPAPMYHRYERGQVPKKDNLRVIAERCGVTIDWLLGEGPENVSAPAQPPSTPCRYPEACNIQEEFGQLREELASMTAQLDTVTRLLGAALGSALPAQRDHNQTPPHKAHPHRAAG